MPQGGDTDNDSCLLTDLAPAQTTATGVLPSSVRSADMSMLSSPPLQRKTEKQSSNHEEHTQSGANCRCSSEALVGPAQPTRMYAGETHLSGTGTQAFVLARQVTASYTQAA